MLLRYETDNLALELSQESHFLSPFVGFPLEHFLLTCGKSWLTCFTGMDLGPHKVLEKDKGEGFVMPMVRTGFPFQGAIHPP